MADTDRPTSHSPDAAEPLLRLEPGAASVPYRPLSGLAMAGFGIAVLYTAVVVGGGLMSFINRVPWLLSFWAVLLPLTGLALSWIASQRIADSEGTLGGAGLASWGIGLSVVFGLLYGAYYAATAIAIRQQATHFVEKIWLDRVRKGELDKAFVLTLASRPSEDSADLRTTLEATYNTPTDKPGAFSEFLESAHVRILKQAGDEARLEPLGVDWGFEKGSYWVRLKYKVNTPFMSSAIQVAAATTEATGKTGKARQWHIVREETGQLKEPPTEPTAAGLPMMVLSGEGYKAVQHWLSLLGRDDQLINAYFETLPPRERSGRRQGLAYRILQQAGPAVAGLGFQAAEPPQAQEFLKGFTAFRSGILIHADPPVFWSSPRNRPDILEEVKVLFGPAGRLPPTAAVTKPLFLNWEEKDGLFHLRVPFTLRSHRFICEGSVMLSTRMLPEGDLSPKVWQVETFQLERGRTRPGGVGPQGPG